MNHDEEIYATVLLSGDAELLSSDILNLRHNGLGKVVRISARVKYAGNRWREWYRFPDIAEGDATGAHKALEALWTQRAISADQYERLERAIGNAERATLSLIPAG